MDGCFNEIFSLSLYRKPFSYYSVFFHIDNSQTSNLPSRIRYTNLSMVQYPYKMDLSIPAMVVLVVGNCKHLRSRIVGEHAVGMRKGVAGDLSVGEVEHIALGRIRCRAASSVHMILETRSSNCVIDESAFQKIDYKCKIMRRFLFNLRLDI